MARGLETALAAVRHDNKATVLSADQIEAHRVFLTGIGIARQEIDLGSMRICGEGWKGVCRHH